MKVSLSWLGVFLILAFLLYFILYGSHVYETFQNEKLQVKEPFTSSQRRSDLNITQCPAGSTSYINNVGITLCCNGTVLNGKCSEKPICSLSEATNTAPTCTEYMEAYLEQKGAGRCPKSMPYYFESNDGTMAGCTSGKRKKDGTGPLGPEGPLESGDNCAKTSNFCRIYPQKVDDEGKMNSCSNQILLESTVCFNNPSANASVTKSLVVNANETAPATVECSYKDAKSNIYTCSTNTSMERYESSILPSGTTLATWKAGSSSWDPLYKLKFCSILEQYQINKTLSFPDLETVKVYNN